MAQLVGRLGELPETQARERLPFFHRKVQRGREPIVESWQLRTAAGEDDGRDPSRSRLREVIVNRAADLVDEGRRSLIDEFRGSLGRNGAAFGRQTDSRFDALGLLGLDVQTRYECVGNVVSSHRQDAYEPRLSLLV